MRASSLRRSTALTSAAICAGLGGGFRNRRVKISRICGTVTAGFFFADPVSLQDHKPQGQQRQRHMVVPPLPTADFVVIQADLAVALLEDLLRLVPLPVGVGYLDQGDLRDGVAQRVPGS